MRVARCAELLAQHHGLDTTRARLAGMLHDLARLYSGERLLEECGIRGLSVNEFERKNPVVLHARLGAEIARERFGVKDAAVLAAIAKHTLGDAEMSALDCAVYLADALEPGRDYPERAGLWELACRDLDEAIRRTLAASLDHYARKGGDVAPQTAAAVRAFALSPKEAQTAGTY